MQSVRIALLGLVLTGLGCQGRNLCLLGYTSAPPFDPEIRSVYVPVFKNTAFHTSPYRGIEADVTEAVVRELNARHSPIRVVSDPAKADTELVGTIVFINKLVQNRTPQNFNREFDVQITVEVVWRDLRSGKVLAGGARGPAVKPPPSDAFDPSLPPPPPDKVEQYATPVRVTATGRVLPELGESNATGAKTAVDNLARQIVNMMEQPWTVAPVH